MEKDIEILYDDPDFCACIKLAGVISEDGGMPQLLAARLGAERIYTVHRLDRDVSGVMVYAKNGKAAAALSRSFAEGKAEKSYCACVPGLPAEAKGELRDLLFHDKGRNKTYVVQRPRAGVKEARLEYETLAATETEEGPIALLQIRLHSGRSHQIRVQFASRKLPLLGDRKYGSRVQCPIALFSRELKLPHPRSGELMCFSAPLPRQWPWTEFGEEG